MQTAMKFGANIQKHQVFAALGSVDNTLLTAR